MKASKQALESIESALKSSFARRSGIEADAIERALEYFFTQPFASYTVDEIAKEILTLPEILHHTVGEPFQRYRLQKAWTLGMTDDFKSQIRSIDRKLQGRILEALAKISSDPVQLVGDTMKPLSGESRGLWRYRLGDFRLIYQPDFDNNVVLLLSFSNRGSAY